MEQWLLLTVTVVLVPFWLQPREWQASYFQPDSAHLILSESNNVLSTRLPLSISFHSFLCHKLDTLFSQTPFRIYRVSPQPKWCYRKMM